jgi:quinol monooxygenase YgiN
LDDKIKDITQISKDKEVITLVNVFSVEPSNQERLIKILEKATEDVMQHLPGFVSANIHRSLDGTKVVNYAQWKNKQAFEDMLQNPEAQIHMNESLSVSLAEPHLYQVVSVYNREQFGL